MDNLEPMHVIPSEALSEPQPEDAAPDIRALLQSFLSRLEAVSAHALETEAQQQLREQAIAAREMNAFVREECQRRGLPDELASCLSFADTDAARRGLDALEAAFRAAVQAAVEERLTGQEPKSPSPADTDTMTDAEYYAMTGFAG